MPKFWDIAGQIDSYFNTAQEVAQEVAQDVVQVAQDVAQDVKTEVEGEIREVLTEGGSSLGETASACIRTISPNATADGPIIACIPTVSDTLGSAPVISNLTSVFNSTQMCGLNNTLNTTAEMCGLDDAPSSYLGYAFGGLAILSGLAGLYGIRRSRADAQKCVSPAVYAIAKDSRPALDLIIKHSENRAVLALLDNEDNMRKLLALETTNQGTLAGIARLTAAPALVALQTAFQPKVEEIRLDDVREVSAPSSSSSSNSVVGTQAASSTPVVIESSPASSSTPATSATVAGYEALMAKIDAKEKSKAAYEKMNEAALKKMQAFIPKLVNSPKFTTITDSTLESWLIGIAAKVGQTIEPAKKAAIKIPH